MLWRALKNVKNGFYVDIGAGLPEVDSVTKYFYERGWHGINIEPCQDDFENLEKARPRDINLNIAIGPTRGTVKLFKNKIRGWSTLSSTTALELENLGGNSCLVDVECCPLQDILDKYICDPIHFLKIDVEGFEEKVLLTINFKKSRPWIIVLEAADVHGKLPDPATAFLILKQNNYEYIYCDGLNFFYICKEKFSELKKYFNLPPNVFDSFVQINSYNSLSNQNIEIIKNLALEIDQKLDRYISNNKKSKLSKIVKSILFINKP